MNCRRILPCIFLLLLNCLIVSGQHRYVLSSFVYRDISDWRFYIIDSTENEDTEREIGYIKMRWPFERNLKEWNIELNERRGSIRQRWNNLEDEWELRLADDYIYLRPTWPNDFGKWQIRSQEILYSINLEPEDDEYLLIVERYDNSVARIYNIYRRESFDWMIEVKDEIPDEILMSLSFLALYYANKK